MPEMTHPGDRRLLDWMAWFETHHGRTPLLSEIAARRGWHTSSAANWVRRMQRDGSLARDRSVNP